METCQPVQSVPGTSPATPRTQRRRFVLTMCRVMCRITCQNAGVARPDDPAADRPRIRPTPHPIRFRRPSGVAPVCREAYVEVSFLASDKKRLSDARMFFHRCLPEPNPASGASGSRARCLIKCGGSIPGACHLEGARSSLARRTATRKRCGSTRASDTAAPPIQRRLPRFRYRCSRPSSSEPTPNQRVDLP